MVSNPAMREPHDPDPISVWQAFGDTEYHDWRRFFENIAFHVYEETAVYRHEDDVRSSLHRRATSHPADRRLAFDLDNFCGELITVSVSFGVRFAAALMETWPAMPRGFDDWVTRAIEAADFPAWTTFQLALDDEPEPPDVA
jgi:hypothetical protein